MLIEKAVTNHCFRISYTGGFGEETQEVNKAIVFFHPRGRKLPEGLEESPRWEAGSRLLNSLLGLPRLGPGAAGPREPDAKANHHRLLARPQPARATQIVDQDGDR